MVSPRSLDQHPDGSVAQNTLMKQRCRALLLMPDRAVAVYATVLRMVSNVVTVVTTTSLCSAKHPEGKGKG